MAPERRKAWEYFHAPPWTSLGRFALARTSSSDACPIQWMMIHDHAVLSSAAEKATSNLGGGRTMSGRADKGGPDQAGVAANRAMMGPDRVALPA